MPLPLARSLLRSREHEASRVPVTRPTFLTALLARHGRPHSWRLPYKGHVSVRSADRMSAFSTGLVRRRGIHTPRRDIRVCPRLFWMLRSNSSSLESDLLIIG